MNSLAELFVVYFMAIFAFYGRANLFGQFHLIGHPLAGDGKYGKNVQNKKTGFPYQALYSYKLIFRFTTEAGMLSYLDGREFTAQDVWFLDEFRAFPK